MAYINLDGLENLYIGRIKYFNGFNKKGKPIFKTTSSYYLFKSIQIDEKIVFLEFQSNTPISLETVHNQDSIEPKIIDIELFKREFPDIEGSDKLTLLLLMDEYNENLKKQAKKVLLPQ